MAEDNVDNEIVEQDAPLTLEDRARERGWRPLDEFEGDESTWVDANTYMVKGELMDVISERNRHIKRLEQDNAEIKDTVQHLKKHYEETAKLEVEKRLKELRAEKAHAMSLDDHERAMELDDEIIELREQQKAVEKETKAAPQNNQPAPEIVAWLKDNPWADDTSHKFDNELAQEGLSLMQAEIIRRGGQVDDIGKVLSTVKSKLERMYPEKFTPQRRPSPSVDAPAPTGKGRGGSLVNKMTAEQRRFGESFVKAGAYDKLEDYAKKLQEMGEIK